MKRVKNNEFYQIWPFRKEERREDGEVNNGGINLVLEPHRIDEIHEATDSNGLRQILINLNRPTGKLMTLSCASGYEDGFYYSYLDFTQRPPLNPSDPSWPDQVEALWLELLMNAEEKFPGIRQWLMANVSMEAREISFRESDPQWIVCIYQRTRLEQDHLQLSSWTALLLEKFDAALPLPPLLP